MKVSKYTCIICPKSCDITVTDMDGELTLAGYGCKRGIEYAQNEYQHPMRMLTTTVKIEGGIFQRLGVIGSIEVPKAMLRGCMQEIYRIQVKAPVHAGDIILPNVLNIGCNVVAATTVEERKAL